MDHELKDIEVIITRKAQRILGQKIAEDVENAEDVTGFHLFYKDKKGFSYSYADLLHKSTLPTRQLRDLNEEEKDSFSENQFVIYWYYESKLYDIKRDLISEILDSSKNKPKKKRNFFNIFTRCKTKN